MPHLIQLEDVIIDSVTSIKTLALTIVPGCLCEGDL
ncbi:hypothetical protein D104_07850 [Marinomonas profundimaris]|uniref:Uncharacterized protein n=1 Tax=Marinomonas profundimaris TaxID=1208321 RepID=W1RV25_9GAMM|nr:hypothetical protein D104_07850 [Marinomonas profundimaris]